MSQAVYDAQSAELARMVDAMLDRPDWLKRWRLLAIYEHGGTDKPIGHVRGMRDGAVIVRRITNDYDGGADDLRLSPLRLLEPITGEPGQRFEMASRRTQFMVDATFLIAAIEAGQSKVVLAPGWTRLTPDPHNVG